MVSYRNRAKENNDEVSPNGKDNESNLSTVRLDRMEEKEMSPIMDLDSKKFMSLDIDDYLDRNIPTEYHKCIDCAKCISPKNKIIPFKYPKSMNTRYVKDFKDTKKMGDFIDRI